MLDQFDGGGRRPRLGEREDSSGVHAVRDRDVASMIEKEAGPRRGPATLAAVIYNRLKDGMKLGIDATLLYDDPTPDDGS